MERKMGMKGLRRFMIPSYEPGTRRPLKLLLEQGISYTNFRDVALEVEQSQPWEDAIEMIRSQCKH